MSIADLEKCARKTRTLSESRNMNSPPSADSPTVSVVLPVYNEADILSELTQQLFVHLSRFGGEYELLYVNDGSTDHSGKELDRLAGEDSRVRVVHLSRNFGHQAAVQAGLSVARGEAVVVMDTDLQDDPAQLPRMLAEWQRGTDVVYAIRTARKEGAVKRFLFSSFYRVLNTISSIPIPRDVGNFCVMDKRVARTVCELLDRDRYFPGLRSWAGFHQKGVEVERLARYDDNPRVSLFGLFRLAKSAIFSFSRFPLGLFYLLAGGSLLACLGLCCYALHQRLISDVAIPGWTSLTITASFFGALNALGIAVLGEYVTRIYDQVRQRPVYLVDRTVNLQLPSPTVIHPGTNPPQEWDADSRKSA